MNDLGDDRNLFDPPRVRRSRPFWKNATLVFSIGLAAISGFTVIGGLVAFLFVGEPGLLAASLVWLIPTGGFAYLARMMAR